MNDLLRFWAKTSHDPLRAPNAYHPLICHMIDVACVALEMWRNVLPQATKRRLAAALGLLDAELTTPDATLSDPDTERDPDATLSDLAATLCDPDAEPCDLEKQLDQTGRFIAFLAGLHDLGKCSPPFAFQPTRQDLRHLFRDNLSREYHKQFCGGGAMPKSSEARHGFVTAAELPGILASDPFNASPQFSGRIAEMIGGHHGIFSNKSAQIKGFRRLVGGNAWSKARFNLTMRLAELCGIHLPLPQNAGMDNALTMILAGFVSVADWIGSNTTYFPCSINDSCNDAEIADFDDNDYYSKSVKNAETALRALGWLDWVEPERSLPFNEMFPFEPRGMQIEAVKLAEKLVSPGIVIVEEPMGRGKTESAIYLADNWNRRLGQRGCYFALPTQATSNQMFGRVVEFLEKRFPNKKGRVSVQLLHGSSALNPDFDPLLKDGAKILRQHDIFDEEETHGHAEDCTAAVIAGEWFTYRKRGLLAPFGVGTIDQSLLAALQTKHVFVRLFGLANKTVIVDEVHAYDAYMSTLLERLLEWLAALHSPVILLSATLPKERRTKLLAAYMKGFGIKELEVKERITSNPNDSYPRMSWAVARTDGFDLGIEKPDETEPEKTIRIRHLAGLLSDEGDFGDLAEMLKKALADGGCAAVVCNTVKRAQKVYSTLREYFKGDERFDCNAEDGQPVIDLLHARFLVKNRDDREKRSLIRFGKEGGKVSVLKDIAGETTTEKVDVSRPTRAILVSTQIIEQSLDLDFDLLVTDLAPIDLILQRAGRLHRHNRTNRAAGFTNCIPEIWILEPASDDNGKPDFGPAKYVYAEHILLRSWLEITKKTHERITIPSDVEKLIESVYDDAVPVSNSNPDAIRQLWLESLSDFKAQRGKDAEEARTRWLKRPSDSALLWRFTENLYAEDSPELHAKLQALTRLAEPSITVICLYGTRENLFLDPLLTACADSDDPSLTLMRALLRNSIKVSGWRLVRRLQTAPETEPPTSWEKKSMLRGCRLLALNENGEARVGDLFIRLDPALGFVSETTKEIFA